MNNPEVHPTPWERGLPALDEGRMPSPPEGLPALDEGRMPSPPEGLPALEQTSTGVAPATQFHRTYLPHFEAGEVPQHICFRLTDSIPRHLLKQWEEELRSLPKAKRDLRKRRRNDETLDKGFGACWLRRPEIARLVVETLNHFAGTRYRLHAWVIMPNHVHVLATPLGDISLSGVVHSWKSYTASRANALLRRQGPFWRPDYFDRFVRNEKHYLLTVEYIHQNPVKAGLCRRAGDWKWSSAPGKEGILPSARAGSPLSQR